MKKVASIGMGLDSVAMVVEAVRRGERPDVCVFVDVGNSNDRSVPGEWPSTYRYAEEVFGPWCAAQGIEFVVVGSEYPVRDAPSLFEWMEARQQIPVSGPTRICTTIAKVERFERWLADRYPGEQVEVWIGFEAGEEARADKDPNAGKDGGIRRNRFPLIEWNLCRCRCADVLRRAGLPVPRKSACTFCPYGTKADFRTLRDELPETFARIAELEANKPLTSKGVKLSIKGFQARRKRKDGTVSEPKGTPLPIYVDRPSPKRKVVGCSVCGAAEKLTKATGCTYLEDAPSAAA